MKQPVRFLTLSLLLVLSPVRMLGQAADGKLQIHFMDVGQGDGAILISPKGETVLFDGGRLNNCDLPLSYLQQLGISEITYLVISHYHADHFGCTPQELQQFPLKRDAIDRGSFYNSASYNNYVQVVGTHRTSLSSPGRKITLDAASPNPVTIEVVALNGDGIPTNNENDQSLVALVTFGAFKAEIGGDLSGFAATRNFGGNVVEYKDIETSVAPKVGPISVYKVHHHCSAYSTNNTWLSITKPIVAVVSAGDTNTYGHPTAECLQRLHSGNVQKTYWTETGRGAAPEPGLDVVGGNIIVEVAAPGNTQFTVTYSGARTDTYSIPSGGGAPPPPPPPATTTFAWSKKSKVFHFSNCSYVANISPDNLERGTTPPAGKHLHAACPVVRASPDTSELSDIPQPPN